ncbi:MAG: tRNA lysidine(34) synthetase TilS [Lentisphaerae bacterium GWF2_50_93]|nr:MAG: tRNA lysidine(34) synthetase TilS [Lentisphaerae bacterium GWF2_50_93]
MDLKCFFSMEPLNGVKNIYSGFSGGPDSTALLILLNDESKRLGFHLKAVHFEHGLRGKEGVADAGWCRKFCEFRNIDFMGISLDVNNSRHAGESVEAAARRLRLRQWKVLAEDTPSLVALGHNANDKVENVFLRLLRGSNSSGLTSLRKIQKIGNITIIRPILQFRRGDIEDFLRSKGISDWRTDSSNTEEDYRRNFFRNKVIPLISERFPNAGSSVLKSIYALEQDADYIESATSDIFKAVKSRKSIEIAYLKAMHPAILVRFLRLWLSEQTGSDYIPDSDFIARFTDEMNKIFENRKTDRSSALIPVNGDTLFLKLKADHVSLCEIRKDEKIPALAWKWRTVKKINWRNSMIKADTASAGKQPVFKRDEKNVFFDADEMPEGLIVRQWLDGDRMIPFGKVTQVGLKKLFESRKMDSERKDSTPVVCTSAGEIIWVPGVRRANFANIGPDTKRFAIFSFDSDFSSYEP